MNQDLKKLAQLHDENIELRKEIESLKNISLEVIRGYARLQIKKDRQRILDAFYTDHHLGDFNGLITNYPIKLD